ncbi:pili assembly chaperone [Pseudomaricurvus alkylphenolicus]|nr:pili assembly chaperone [Pseudomaricurvus alkylphenolicus]NIB44036.1 pili assembly chaperone [Pseudomaricurvus alkylphenolicus]
MTLNGSPVAIAANQTGADTSAHLQVGRYSLMSTAPSTGQVDLLAVTVERSIPETVKSIGNALDWLLQGSGYRLADTSLLSDEAIELFHLPLPSAHRQFQALPLRQVLSLIVGPAFSMVHDPAHRLLGFERCSRQTPEASASPLIKKQ